MSSNASRDKLTAELDDYFGGSVRVTSDPRNINPPCVFVGMPTALDPAPCGWTGEIRITAIAPGPANEDAGRWLLDVLDEIRSAVMCISATETAFYPDPSASTGFPAYEIRTLFNS